MKWIIVILLIILVFLYYLKTIIDSFKISFEVEDINLTDVSLSSLNKGTSFIQTTIKFLITFNSFFNLRLSDIDLKTYYEGVLVAQTAINENNKKQIILKSNSINKIYHTFDIRINSSTINLAKRIKFKENYKVDYKISFKLFGIPLNKKGTYTKSYT